MPATPKPFLLASGATIAPVFPPGRRWILLVLAGLALARVSSAAPTVTVAPPGISDLAGTTIELDAIVSGAAPGSFQVQWNLSGNPVGSSASNYTISSLGPSSAGPYSAAISAPSGSATSAPVAVSIGAGYTISTLAGVGGGTANGVLGAAQFQAPSAVAVDRSGKVYVADTANNLIRVYDPVSGMVSNLAGAGSGLSSPSGVAVDPAGVNVYIADTGNNVIRTVKAGVMTVLAGSTSFGGSADGNGANAQFNAPAGLVFDPTSGGLYVADAGNHLIRSVTTSGLVVTVAGTAGVAGSLDGNGTAAMFNDPTAVAVDANGNIYVADTGNDTVRAVSAPGSMMGAMVTTLAGTPGIRGSADGMGAMASFDSPAGVAVDTTGNVYVADTGSDTIRKVTALGLVSTIAGTPGSPGGADGAGPMASFNAPSGLAFDAVSGGLYAADTNNDTLRTVTLAGTVATVAGTASTGTADGTSLVARFLNPVGVAVDASGNVYVADPTECAIRMISPLGMVSTLAGGTRGSADGTGPAAAFNGPNALAVDAAGNLYVADTGNDTVRMIAPGGVVTTLAGAAGKSGSADGPGPAARFDGPLGVAVDASGDVWIADSGNGTIRRISPKGLVTTVAGTAGVDGYLDGTGAAAQFDELEGVATDANGNAYAVEGTGTVREITPQGIVTTLAGTYLGLGDVDGSPGFAQFYQPQGIAVDANGDIFVANTAHQTIREIAPSGTVSTLAGTAGVIGSLDATGSTAQFFNPGQIALDSFGNLYVADSSNHTVRMGIPPMGLPVFTQEPSGQSVVPGGAVTLDANANGIPAPTYQWYLNGTPISGATMSSYLIPSAQASDAGNYFISASNSAGLVFSSLAVLQVGTASAPVITRAPASQTVAPGANATFSAAVSGTNPLSFQWNFNGTPIPGATSSAYTISGASTSDDGPYSVTVTNPAGTVTSAAATLNVSSAPTGARLADLSVRALVGADSSVLIAGFYASGSGQKNILLRAVGPSLATLGITNYLAQPQLDLFNSSSVEIASNDGWGNSPALAAAFASVGAFPLLTNSSDGALELSLPSGTSFTEEVSGAMGATGVALAEVYDADPNIAASPTRLANLSARASVGTASSVLIAGFVVSGAGTETVLVRAVGPTLTAFGLGGLLQDPVLTLYDAQGNVITSNQGWQNPVAVPGGIWAGQATPTNATHATFGTLGAFDLADGSTDSAFVIALPVGAYTAEVAGANGTTGVALVELYELPQ
jgi:sugar lactone lactonase YvrE